MHLKAIGYIGYCENNRSKNRNLKRRQKYLRQYSRQLHVFQVYKSLSYIVLELLDVMTSLLPVWHAIRTTYENVIKCQAWDLPRCIWDLLLKRRNAIRCTDNQTIFEPKIKKKLKNIKAPCRDKWSGQRLQISHLELIAIGNVRSFTKRFSQPVSSTSQPVRILSEYSQICTNQLPSLSIWTFNVYPGIVRVSW